MILLSRKIQFFHLFKHHPDFNNILFMIRTHTQNYLRSCSNHGNRCNCPNLPPHSHLHALHFLSLTLHLLTPSPNSDLLQSHFTFPVCCYYPPSLHFLFHLSSSQILLHSFLFHPHRSSVRKLHCLCRKPY